MRMTPNALRKDPGGLDRRRIVEVTDDRQRSEWEPPGPAHPPGIVLRIADHSDDTEDRLPDSGIEDRVVSLLNGRPLAGRMSPDVLPVHACVEWALASTADQEPVRQSFSMTTAIAWPKPM